VIEISSPPEADLDYIALQSELIHTAADLSRLATLCATAGDAQDAQKAEDRLNHLASGAFVVAVIGQFKRGKSTLANALLGAEIMPADIEPTTAAINRVVYGRSPRAVLHMADGSTRPVPIDSLAAHITKLSAESERNAAQVAEAVVSYPTRLCLNNVQLLDTPGLDDVDPAMTERTRAVLSRIDAALVVSSALSALESSEIDVLLDVAGHVDVSRIFVVVNHADRIDEADRPRVAEAARRRCAAALRVAEPRLYMVSARNALRAKLRNDARALEQSGFPLLEAALEQFLVRDSGMARVQSANEHLDQLACGLRERSQARHQALEAVDRQSQDRLSLLERQLDDVVQAIADWPEQVRMQVEALHAAADAQAASAGACLQRDALAALAALAFTEDDIRRELRHAKLRAALGPPVLDGFDSLQQADRNMLLQLLQGLASAFTQLSTRWDDALKETVANAPASTALAQADADGGSRLATAIEQALAVHEAARVQFRERYAGVCDMLSLKAEALGLTSSVKWLSNQRTQVVAGFAAEYREHVPTTLEQAFGAAQLRSLRGKAVDGLVALLMELHTELASYSRRALDERKWILRLERERIDKDRVRAEERALGVLSGARDIATRAAARRTALRTLAGTGPGKTSTAPEGSTP
jgi:tRNA U34 5-carboxymethylaminomethyl modifying GTPase MnmE/TrmE